LLLEQDQEDWLKLYLIMELIQRLRIGIINLLKIIYWRMNDLGLHLFLEEELRVILSLINYSLPRLQSLAKSFEGELAGKERDILQAKALLTSIHTEVTETTRVLQGLGDKSGAVQEKKRELEKLQAQLRSSVGESMRKGWEAWVGEDEAREGRWRGGIFTGEELGDLDELTDIPEEKRKRRKELVKQYVRAQAEVSTFS
jgi:transcription factor MBP1